MKMPGSKGFKYRDKDLSDGPCKVALIKPGKLLKALCLGSAIGFTLDEPTQGGLSGAIQMGTGRSHCMEWGGGTMVKDKQAANGKVGIFVGRNASAPADCSLP